MINAYTLTFGGLLLLGGRIADVFGHRRSALIGLSLFGLTSLLGGLAQTPAELIAARALQGIAAAMLLPISLTLITVAFAEGPARHRALATWGAVAGPAEPSGCSWAACSPRHSTGGGSCSSTCRSSPPPWP